MNNALICSLILQYMVALVIFMTIILKNMHKITLMFKIYLEGFNFVCCYAFFLLNDSYFFLLVFQFCF